MPRKREKSAEEIKWEISFLLSKCGQAFYRRYHHLCDDENYSTKEIAEKAHNEMGYKCKFQTTCTRVSNMRRVHRLKKELEKLQKRK